MLQVKIAAFFLAIALCCSCSTGQERVVSNLRDRTIVTTLNRSKRVIKIESFYFTPLGVKVLHGDQEKYSVPGSSGIKRVYEHGKLIKTSWISINS